MSAGAAGAVHGSTPTEAATRLAGALAELGETRIDVQRPGAPARRLDARRTDLPVEVAALARCGGGTLTCVTLGVSIDVRVDRLEWRADNPDTAHRLSEALRA